MKINLENAENVIKALKRMKKTHGEPYCPCKIMDLTKDNICPCKEMITENKCCCGLYEKD